MNNEPNKGHNHQGENSHHRKCWKCIDGIVTYRELTICNVCYVEAPEQPMNGWNIPEELALPRNCRTCSDGIVTNTESTICLSCWAPILDAALELI